MSRYLYTARLAPIGKPVRLRIKGEGMCDVRLDEFCLPLANRARLRVDHDQVDIGQFHTVIRHGGWHLGTFTIDEGMVDEETEALVKRGAPVSIGLGIVRSQVDPATGIEDIHQAELDEVSLTRRGCIEGAMIVSKDRLRPVRPPTLGVPPARPRPAVRREPALNAGDVVFYGTGEELWRRPGRQPGLAAGETLIPTPPGTIIRRYYDTKITVR